MTTKTDSSGDEMPSAAAETEQDSRDNPNANLLEAIKKTYLAVTPPEGRPENGVDTLDNTLARLDPANMTVRDMAWIVSVMNFLGNREGAHWIDTATDLTLLLTEQARITDAHAAEGLEMLRRDGLGVGVFEMSRALTGNIRDILDRLLTAVAETRPNKDISDAALASLLASLVKNHD